MKRDFLILFTMLLTLSVGAQVKQEVIASAGGFNVATGNTISISWTLGETIIPTFTSQDGSLILTHGFQQKLIITAVEENIVNPVKITVYPNPTSEIINLEFDTPTDGEFSLYLFNAQGKMVKTDQIGISTINKEINMQDLPAGIYYLRLIKGKLVNVYKVVKL
jgi:Secretion system C-terminal sorting domain